MKHRTQRSPALKRFLALVQASLLIITLVAANGSTAIALAQEVESAPVSVEAEVQTDTETEASDIEEEIPSDTEEVVGEETVPEVISEEEDTEEDTSTDEQEDTTGQDASGGEEEAAPVAARLLAIEEPQSCMLVSDETTEEGQDGQSEILSFVHSAWATISDAFWIWGDNPVGNPAIDQTEEFEKHFTLSEVPDSAEIEIAADNGYILSVNGTEVANASVADNNYNPTDTYDVASLLVAGENHLHIEVTNVGTPEDPNPENNPAGLIYKLTIEGAVCGTQTPPEEDEVVVHIFKYLKTSTSTAQVEDGAGIGGFPMHAEWDADNIGTGGGNYELGGANANLGGAPYEYSARTSPMTEGADYTTYERTTDIYPESNVFPIGAECEAGMYRLVGYGAGEGIAGAEAAELTEEAPQYTDIGSDRYLIVVNEDCDDVLNPEEPEEPGMCEIVSDTSTLEGGNESVLVTFMHESWTAFINGASWIWGEDPVMTPESEITETFTKTFTLDGTASTSTLYIAADNSYSVSLNGTEIASSTDEDNYTSSGQDEVEIDESLLVEGENTLEFTVTNWEMEGGTTETNPAGLKYRLVIDGADCEPGEDPSEDGTIQVHIYKHLTTSSTTDAQVSDDSTAPDFPMTATWSATNIGAGSGNYVLGNSHGGAAYVFAADTSEMTVGADYTTSEITDGSVVVPADSQCVEGKYRLVGYKWGMTHEEAMGTTTISTTAPSFTDLMSDRYIVVVNEDCDGEPELPPVDPGTCEIVSDELTMEDDSAASLVSTIHGAWTAVIAGASWIWGEDPVGDPVNGDTQVFTRTFTLASTTASTTTLYIAADNTYSVSLNGTEIASSTDEDNFSAADTIVIDPTDLNVGANTLEFTVTNLAQAGGTESSNPGGLLYRLIVEGDDCEEPGTPGDTSETITVSPNNMNGWAFFTENTNSGQTGDFTTGPGTPPLGDGSARFILTDGTQGEALGTFVHAGLRLDDIEDLRYSTYRATGTPAVALALQFEIDNDVTDADNTFKGRLVYEPYHTQTVSTGVWQEWNTLNDAAGTGTGNWWFSNGVLAAGSGCTQANPCTWSEVLGVYPDAGIRDGGAFTGLLLFKAGSGWTGGFEGSVDEFVIATSTTPTTTHTATYDFEPNEVAQVSSSSNSNGRSGGSSRSGSGGGNNNDDGEVLGASTDDDFFGVGGADPGFPDQVSFLPFGAPNTGEGGTSLFLTALGLGLLLAFWGVRGRVL